MPGLSNELPTTVENRHFPLGDITLDERKAAEKRAIVNGLIEKIDDPEQAREYVFALYRAGRHEHAYWYRDEDRRNVKQIRTMMYTWSDSVVRGSPGNYASDDDIEKAGAIGSIGFFSSIKISRQGFLPPVSHDFSDEFMDMLVFNREDLSNFSNNIWTGMHKSHPQVYAFLAPYAIGFVRAFNLEIENDNERLMAELGIGLPYHLSAHSRGWNYLEMAIEREGVLSGAEHKIMLRDHQLDNQ